MTPNITNKVSRSLGSAVAAIAAFGSLLSAAPVSAQGDLLVAPTRIILDGRRGTEVILSNIGSEEATYRIGLELRRMTATGQLVEVETEAANELEQAALSMVRYAPRRITLPPGQPQAVRISARPGAELPDGEYRVHMSFRAIPQQRPITATPEESQGISIKLIPMYGVTIPVIIRHGRLESTVAISNPQVAEGPRGPELRLAITRSGAKSTYGELRVTRPGSDDPIFLARGIAIYSEVSERIMQFELTPEQTAAMKGQLRFEYREMPEAGGAVIAVVDTVLG
ncbi:molecular chaperone [Allopontixanthobacter sp.]|uniref:molecular chaperone n=1 Tax=Allopontixanthobacter sp. TaxID=2906452 RepID=UPI002ABB8932|nr:molecular chaperone [Allopontixanthobacter sp.]MDZ4308471.1 molecular chaperone [Allopontixanthobacter sp.]